MQVLTKENAATVKSIRNINNPSWGVKKFNYRPGGFSSFGVGADSAVIHEGEFKFWEVVETK